MKTTDTLDKLYLEWSQFTEAKTGRELALERRIENLRMALDRLARLGNAPNYGNSVGNDIAREALEKDNNE